MPVTAPYPELDEILASMGVAGSRISEIDASEAGAGQHLRPARLGGRGPPPLPPRRGDRAAAGRARAGRAHPPRHRLRPPPAPDPRGPGRGRGRRVHEGGTTATLYTAPRAAVREAHQRAQLPPRRPQGSGGAARRRLPGRRPRPADAPDLPQPHPGLPLHRGDERAASSAGSRSPSSPSPRASGSWTSWSPARRG